MVYKITFFPPNTLNHYIYELAFLIIFEIIIQSYRHRHRYIEIGIDINIEIRYQMELLPFRSKQHA